VYLFLGLDFLFFSLHTVMLILQHNLKNTTWTSFINYIKRTETMTKTVVQGRVSEIMV
jgi:hypothetical protein